MSICQKKKTNVFVEFHHLAEAATGGALQKKGVFKTLQYSLENTCV